MGRKTRFNISIQELQSRLVSELDATIIEARQDSILTGIVKLRLHNVSIIIVYSTKLGRFDVYLGEEQELIAGTLPRAAKCGYCEDVVIAIKRLVPAPKYRSLDAKWGDE